MRLFGLAAILAIAAGACTSKPAVPPVDVTGIPSKIRILVAPSRTEFYVQKGVFHGDTVEHAAAFKKFLDAEAKSSSFEIQFIETPQDALIPDLLAGKGEIAANLLLTFERDDQVAFAKPILRGIREFVVTGPTEKPLVSLEDIGGRTIHVRKTSDHYASLLRLNAQLTGIHHAPATVVASSAATDEDLLEMANAGKIPATIADDYVFDRWSSTFDKLNTNRNVAVSQDGQLAWVTRKDMPKLLAVMNEFFGLLHGDFAKGVD